MPYRVELTERAARDLRRLYRTIAAEHSAMARAWLTGLERAIASLDQNPARNPAIREDARYRHLLYGRGRNVYRVIYEIDAPERAVVVIHIRHGARDAFPPDRDA